MYYHHLKRSNCYVILLSLYMNSNSSHQRCSIKKLLLKILQYSQDNICVGVSFNRVAGLYGCNVVKKRLQHSCFLVNIAKFFRTPILNNIYERLLLKLTLKIANYLWKFYCVKTCCQRGFEFFTKIIFIHKENCETGKT